MQPAGSNVRCKNESMTLPTGGPPDHPEPSWEGRARVVFGKGQRQFVHVWSAPRSRVARVVMIPLLLLATLLILAVGLLALLVLAAVALVVAFFVVLVGAPLAAIRGRSRP